MFGKFLQQLRSSAGSSGDSLDQVLDIGMFLLDEAQNADVLLLVQELMEQTVAIVSS